MVRVVRSTIVSAPIEAVWDVVRDFNGHDRWHPIVVESHIERGLYSDRVGCVRNFRLANGTEMREKLLTLSDLEWALSYCLLDTPLPIFNYVAHVRLLPVTDGHHTFWEWLGRFDAPTGRETELASMIGNDIYQAGFDAVRSQLEASTS
ncbi:SRPBCC family protein [Mesorhizobium sp. M0830]|uniref:SRPBCC family protein n=1 Tax=unclassified Mesorhizobium TaxID=325217 RepID=UPI0003CE25E6|nr:SRPBCC family protein [Mesorhizobium sp. LSHC412B00]ESX90858.1 polyketide cyclase [Mesorhizobium sp. LSHC412B00]